MLRLPLSTARRWPAHCRRMRHLQRFQPLFVAVALIFVFYLLRSQWAELSNYRWRLDAGWLALFVLLLLASWALEIEIWRRLLRISGGGLDFWPAVRIWFLSAILRYIPGNLWQPMNMALQCRGRGIRPEATLTSVLLFQVVLLLGVAPIALVYVIYVQASGSGTADLVSTFIAQQSIWLLALFGLPLLVFVLRPSIMTYVLNRCLGMLGRAPLTVELTTATLIGLVVVATVNWLLWGGAFAALAFGISAVAAGNVAALSAHLALVYPLAYLIGFLSLITPSGLGIREGALYILLAPYLAGAIVTVIALTMRLLTTIGELLMAGLVTVLIAAGDGSTEGEVYVEAVAQQPPAP